MNAEQFATRVLQVKAGLTALISAQLPAECSIVDRFIFSGVTTEEDWLTTLRGSDDKIRILAILMSDLNLGKISGTNMGGQFNPIAQFNLELYHEYRLGTASSNTELEFTKDAARIQFGLAKSGRKIMNPDDATECVGIMDKTGMRLGMRPSKITTLHYGRGQVIVDMRDLPYS
jgi:hypothetical protein